MYIPAYIGIGYCIGMNHRQMLLIRPISMRERRVLRIDVPIGYPASVHGHVLGASRGIPQGEIDRPSFRRGVSLRPPAKRKKAFINAATDVGGNLTTNDKKHELTITKTLI